MDISYILIPISIALLIIVFAVLAWAVLSGQYDDLDRQGSSILFEEQPESPKHPPSNTKGKVSDD